MRAWGPALLATLACACRQDMHDQPRYKPLAKSEFFDDKRASRAQVEGTVVSDCAGGRVGDLRLGHPSGVLPIAASVGRRDGVAWAERVTVYRTARRLMEGYVRIP